MSYTNGTTHYNLPQTTGTDKRDWSDTNQAFQDIDAALYQATQDTAQAALDIDALEARMDTAEQNISTNSGDISALDTRLTTAEGTITQHTGQIADVRQDAEDMICAYNESSATSTHAYAVDDYFIYNDVLYRAIQPIAIGDTIVPDTNCTTTNVASELKTKVIATVEGDGIITYAEAFARLYNMASFNVNRQYELVRISTAGNVEKYLAMNIIVVAPAEATFTRTFVSSDQIHFINETLKLNSTAGLNLRMTIDTTTSASTLSNNSNNTFTGTFYILEF